MQPEDSDREAVSRSQTKFRMTVDLKFNYSKKYEKDGEAVRLWCGCEILKTTITNKTES